MNQTMANKAPFTLYNSKMNTPNSYTKRFRQLRWKLTLSYTGVTVLALLTVELIFLASTAIVVAVLLNSGVIQTELINAVSKEYRSPLKYLLSQTPPDQDGITALLDQAVALTEVTIPLTFNGADQVFVVGHDGVLLASNPRDLIGIDAIGHQINMQALPGLADPLQAALSGEADVNKLFTLPGPDERVIMAFPIWDESHEKVLGVMVGIGEFPTVKSALREIIPIMGISFLVFTSIAGVLGMVYGSFAARGLSTRLNRLSEGTYAWRQGDFTQLVEDTSGDEIGQLAYNLNQMARQLQHLLDTRTQLMVVEERNRLARDLHDSAKQQAFAAAAQISAARKLMPQNPEAGQACIEEAEHLIDDLRNELTNLIKELRPAALRDKGLASSVREFAEDWSRQNVIELRVNTQHERGLPLDIEQMIFRIIQEALSNVARHSQAKSAGVLLAYDKHSISCTISDDGVGFDLKDTSGGFGIRSMQERAKALGSAITLDTAPDKGTQISFTVTLENPDKNEEEVIHE